MRNTTLKLASLALAGFGVVMSGNAVAASDMGTDSGMKAKPAMKATSQSKSSMVASKDSTAGRWIKPIGTMQFDQVFFDGDGNDAAGYPSGSNIRRAYLGVMGGFDESWSYIARADLSRASSDTTGSRVLDAYMTYHPNEMSSVSFGQMRPALGMSSETADESGMFMERALPVDAFRPTYSLGIFGGLRGEMLNLTASVFTPADKIQQSNGGSDPVAFASRLVFAPIMDEEQVLHMGASYLYQDMHDNHNTLSFSVAPEAVARGTTGFASTTLTNAASHYTVYGMELAGQWHSFTAQAEYFHTNVERNAGASDLTYKGYYAQLGYVLTGEKRPYCFKNGAFYHVKPTSKDGAWELAVRHSRLTFAVAEHDTSIALNWWLNDNVSVSANYVRASIEQAAAADKELDIIGLRGQFTF